MRFCRSPAERTVVKLRGAAPLKCVVLDTTELRKDWLQTGLTAQLLGHASFQHILRVAIPPSVVEEIVAHHTRARAEQLEKYELMRHAWRRIGIGTLPEPPEPFDYRGHLTERFDEILGFDVLTWPIVSHKSLVARATYRKPPFNEKGSGYRDSLVWESVLELVAKGSHVALVTADTIFQGPDKSLASALVNETENLPGSVELVTELVPWLLAQLPWAAADIRSAISLARDQDFFDYFVQSDIQDDFVPDATDIGFDRAPFRFDIESVEWDGGSVSLGSRIGPDGVVLSEYDFDELVTFEAELPDHCRLEDGWTIIDSSRGAVTVAGEVKLTLRLAVLFDEGLTFSVEQLSWRRRDGLPGGPSVLEPDPTSIPLFE